VNVLGARGRHFFVNDVFDFVAHPETEGKPGENTGGLPSDVARANQPFIAGDIRIGRVFPEGTNKKVTESADHRPRLPPPTRR
jgi:hypothetical protein